MRRTLLSAGLLTGILNVMAVNGGRDERNVTFIRDPKRTPDLAWQAELRARPQWRAFVAGHGTWWTEFNEANGLPHRAFGTPIGTVGADPVAKAWDFLQHQLAGFGLPLGEVSVRAVYPTAKHTFVHFSQTHAGLPVVFGQAMVKLDGQGRVIAFGTDLYPGIQVEMQPGIGGAAAVANASSGLTGITGSEVNGLRILPVPGHRSVEHRLVHEVVIHTMEQGIPGRWSCWVDAHSGELLYRQDLVVHHAPPASAGAEIAATATAHTVNPYVPATTEVLPDLRVVVNGLSQYLDDQGYLNTGVGGPVNATFFLDGRWCNVKTGGSTPSFQTTLQEGPNAVSFNADANLRERSAYYHVNVVHDHMKDWLPSFTALDVPFATNVDVAGNCNAFYDGGSINFYQEGNDCQSYAQIAEVVYHEYGHGINDKFYGELLSQFTNGAMNEGYADVWALSITEDPVLAEGSSLSDPDDYIRRYDENRKVYPVDLVGQVHADGEIIAGAWWDTYLLLGSDMNAMLTLFVEAFPGLQANTVNGNEGQAFRDVLLDALQADDNDGDITNGTPNAGAIVEAFALHGITLLSNATLVHSNLEMAAEAQGIDLDAQLILDFDFLPFLSEVKLFYRLNDETVWNTLPMVDFGSNDYHATIPPQPAGTVVAYYMGVEDSFQQLSAVVPIGAAEPDPNVPYYIMVGFGLVATDDADNNTQLGNWDIGLPTDNATTGEWEFNMPVGSYATPGDPSTVVQPGEQHTPNGEICYVTGNASTELAPLGENDVDGGTTTLRSAALDLSSMQEPAISYWRWYVNDPPSGANPGADWWQVWLSNDGASWVPVENTKTSDRSWRRVAFRVGDFVTPNATVYIKYNASDSIRPGQNLDGGSLVEAAVDDIQLWDLAAGIGIEETPGVELLVFPKPAQDQLQVRGAWGDARSADLLVLDASGRVVVRQQVSGAALRERVLLNIAGLAPGSYVLQVITERARGEERFQVVR
ncbi:MAG TPA: hypothetical protein PKE21_00270 [Flavobacteriales bacterium]|nr:hypothetical protein [Flavobacteriales bacterium]HMR25887.1 hypothetical protein [Flavobacteriales bacterium]